MSAREEWLARTKSEVTVLSEAYRLRMVGRLWWANLIFVVFPAVLTTAAAILAALPSEQANVFPPHLAAWFAGAAAVLMAVHRSLKCEEYQSECLRLSQGYKSIAISLDSELSTSEEGGNSLQDITKKLELLTESAKAPLPTGYIRKAEAVIAERAKLRPC